MAAPQELPCTPWTTVDKLCCPDVADISRPCPPGAPTPATYVWSDEELIQMASKILFERTCRRFPGECEVTLRPCDPCRSCGDCCRCRYEYIPLAGVFPVLEVTEVRIDGTVVPPASYRVDEYIRLVRTDGEQWPRWQNLGQDPDVPGVDQTMIVRYTTGRPVPPDLQYAAALLACELKRACNGQGCSLPDRVQSVVRDGVSYQVLDSQEVAINGSFGVPVIDAILKSYKCDANKPRIQMTTRLFHPLMDGERYDRGGVRG